MSDIVSNFVQYLKDGHKMSEKNAEYERVLKLLRANKDANGVNDVKEAYDEYLIDGRAWVDMEQEMRFDDENF
jgi:hypothetical protein